MSGGAVALSSALPEKGLENPEGAHNCFLNVSIQTLWHLRSFREQFAEIGCHHHHRSDETCAFCALKSIFVHFEFSEETLLQPTALRRALSTLYTSVARFQLGRMDDASEALEALLDTIHDAFVQPENTSGECNPPCLAHRVFGLQLCEQSRCEHCHETSEPMPYFSFVHYVPVATLLDLRPLGYSFQSLLRVAMETDLRPCHGCRRPCPVFRHLLAEPHVFTIGLIWDSAIPPVEQIMEVASLVPHQLDIGEVFWCRKNGLFCTLRGMVAYYGHHYKAFVQHSQEPGQWLYFDDEIVTHVGTWDDVLTNVHRGHWQPSILFYEWGSDVAIVEDVPPADLEKNPKEEKETPKEEKETPKPKPKEEKIPVPSAPSLPSFKLPPVSPVYDNPQFTPRRIPMREMRRNRNILHDVEVDEGYFQLHDGAQTERLPRTRIRRNKIVNHTE